MNAPQSAAPLAAAAAGGDRAERARRQAEVVAALSSTLPPRALLWNAEDTVPYECDGLTAYRQQPLVVALPETEAQVAAVLAACHRLNVPVVARGAGTGLSGGAMPHGMGVTLSLAKFNKILAGRPAVAHRARAVRREEPRRERGRRALRALLRARPVEPDRLHHRRQRGRELGRRALPEIRPDRAQRAARAAATPSRASRSSSAPRRSTRPASTCSPPSSAARACSPSPPRSPSGWCPSRCSRAASWPASTT